MKHFYRLLTLAALLLLPLLPVRADGDTIASGQLTTTLDWALTSDGVLHLVGTGRMPDTFNYPDYGPWYTYRSQITAIDFPQGLTSIGQYAFYFCDNLSTVVIPEGVTAINYCAFSGCEILSSISFPSTLDTIGSAIVADAHVLTELVIPASVTSIGSRLTDGCQLLTSLVVEEGNTVYSSYGGSNVVVRVADNYLLAGCQTSVIPSTVVRIGMQAFSSQRKMTSITIPASVTTIDDSAFEYCSALESLTCEAETPPTLGGNYVFQRIDTSIPVYVPANSLSAYQTASGWSNFTNFQAIGSDSGTGTDSTQTDDTFEVDGLYYRIVATQANAVEVIRNPTVTSNGYSGDIVIPETISAAGAEYDVVGIAYNAFTSCYNMTSIYIPASVTSIEDGSFLSTVALRSITISPANTVYNSGDGANAIIETATNRLMVGCRTTIIPSTVTSIGNSAFNFCSAMEAIEIPNSVTTIGDYAFYWCESLSTITIPSSVISIGNDAFEQCTGLTSFTCEAETPPYLGTDAFLEVTNTIPLYVPANSLSLYQADQGWSYFRNIKAIGDTTSTEPEGCYLAYGDLTTTMTWVLTCDHVLQITGTGNMPNFSYPDYGPWYTTYRDSIYAVEISDGVTALGEYAFYGLSHVTNLFIPEGVTLIDYCALASMYELSTVSFPTTLQTIDDGVLSSDWALKSLYIPASVTSIGSRLTESAGVLSSIVVDEANPVYNSGDGANAIIVTATNRLIAGCAATVIPETVTTIGNNAFSALTGLTSITIPASVTSIESNAFSYCSKLTEIYCLSESPASVGNNAFKNVTTKATLYVPDYSVSTYQEAAGWSEFTNIQALPVTGICGDNLTWSFTSSDSTLTITGTGAMYNYGEETVSSDGGPSNGGQMAPWFEQEITQSIYHLSLPEGLTSIGSSAFYYLSNLSSVNIPSTVTTIGDHAFDQCFEMTECTVAESGITSIGEYAFNYCQRLTTFEIPSTVTTIGEGAFQSCTNLHYAIIPAGVTTIQPNTFYSCQMLSTVYFYDGLQTIGNSAFNACKRMTKITLPSTVTSIGDNAFEYCEALSMVDLSENLTTIGRLAFYGCPFSTIELPATLTSIGYGAFMSCSNIAAVTSLATTPPTIQSEATGATADAFPEAPDTLVITVPYTSIAAYQEAQGWSRYTYQAQSCEEVFESTEAAEMCYGSVFVWHDKELTEAGEYQDTLKTDAGCDSIVTLNLTYAPSYDFVDSMYVCESDLPFIWHDREFMTAGDYSDSLETAFGCDSVYKLHLEILTIPHSYDTAQFCYGESYIWNGQTYTAQGDYETTIRTQDGCDSVAHLHLTENPIYFYSDTINFCEDMPYEWHGRTIKATGNYFDSLQTVYGCDSIYELVATVNQTYASDESAEICEGDAYTWYDQVYTETGTYETTLTALNGCDSVVTLHLTVNPTYAFEETGSTCEGTLYVWHNREYATAGIYYDSLQTLAGCDSIYRLTLTVRPTYAAYDTAAICYGETYTWNGQPYSAQGDYEVTFEAQNGCDSIAYLHLTENPVYFYSDTITLCENMPYEWHGQSITSTKTYYDSLQTIYGCDSIYELVATINQTYASDESAEICEGDAYTWYDQVYTETGTYETTLTALNGCDSVVTLHLTVNPTAFIEETGAICQGGTYAWHRRDLTEAGIYYDTLQTIHGCDSVFRLTLIVYPSYSFEEEASTCQGSAYTWHGRDLTNAGIYYDSLQTVTGCDSIYQLTLTVNPTYATDLSADICQGETYTWNGQQYTAQGNYDMTLTALNGCDSVVTLHLTVNPTFFYEESAVTCQGSAYNWHGRDLTNAGIYYDSLQTVTGCDSIFQLTLTVNPTYASEESAEICEGDAYTWYDQVYTETGTYETTLTALNGCDSVVTLHLTVNPTAFIEETGSTCEGTPYIWHEREYTTSGVYYDSLQTLAGCDSIYRLTLTVRPTYAAYDTAAICYGETYTWNGQPYSAQGDYEVTFEAQNGCDSIAHLHLTENPVYFYSDTITLCENMPYEWHGRTIKATGNYYDSLQTVYGCDSIYVLVATVNQTYASEESAEICEGGAYTWYDQVYTETGTYETTLTALNGCDSVVTLHLTVNPTYAFEETGSTCEGTLYVWHNREYATAGIYYDSLQTLAGCDSIYRLTLTVRPTYAAYDTAAICYGETYTWNGQPYSAQGDYEVTFEAQNGCDSIAYLHLTENPVYFYSDTITLCENMPYEWHGRSIKATGNYYDSLQTVYGCDSIYELVATVNQTYASDESAEICEGDAYTWYDQVYTETGTYETTLTALNGCDSVVTLHLTVNPTAFIEETGAICQGGTYAWHRRVLTEAGIYYDTLQTIHGCDSVFRLTLIVYPSYSYEEEASTCQGSAYTWHGRDLTNAGIYYDSLQTVYGCDSIYQLTLTVNPTYATDLSAEICQGETYTWNGQQYTAQGNYDMTLTALNGCDSVVTLHLTVNPTFFYEESATTCENVPYTWHGRDLTNAGIYYDSLQTVTGCDSIFQLTLTVNPTYASEESAEICEGDAYTWYDQVYTETGTYETTLASITGCDSVVTLHLTVNPTYLNDETAVTCQGTPYSWHGRDLTEAGIYYDTLQTIHGCDSVFRLTLTVYPSYFFEEEASTCQGSAYTWHGRDLTNAGIYYDSLQTVYGCDSIFQLTLTVNPTYATDLSAEICQGETYTWNGQQYTAQGNYDMTLTALNGCDSVVTLHLTVNPTFFYEESAVTCQGTPYSWHGRDLYQSGIYYDTLHTVFGCDSVIRLMLTVHATYTVTEEAAICDGDIYTWHGRTYTKKGIYTDTLPTLAGCDSICTLVLTANPQYLIEDIVSIREDKLPYIWQGESYTEAGNYRKEFISIYGCDSVHTLQLIVTELPIYTVTVIADHGVVNGTGTYPLGTTIHLEAIPDEGFEFQMWSDGSEINPKDFVVTQDTTLRALFYMPEVEQEVVVDSIETNSVTIVWDTVAGATLYELRIFKNGELVVIYEVDPDNNIVGEHHTGPDRLIARKDSTGGSSETLQVSVGGLEPGQDYTYSLDAMDDDRSYVGAQSGSFTTEEEPDGLDSVLFDDRRPQPRKILQDGHLYIELPDGTRYSPEGALLDSAQ